MTRWPRSKLKFLLPWAVSNHSPWSRGLPGFTDEVAVDVQNTTGVGGEEMGDDVAFLHDGEELADDLGGVAPCSFLRMTAEGLALPFMIWDRCEEMTAAH